MLKPCRECGDPVSDRAKICPHCGIKKPLQHPVLCGINDVANGMMGCGCLLMLIPLLLFLFSLLIYIARS